MGLKDQAKAKLYNAIYLLGYTVRRNNAAHYLESDPSYAEIIRKVRPFTLTSCERIAAVIDSVRHIVNSQIPGAFVECGVWRGGSMMAAALTLMETNEIRDIYLFDTYAGMTAPTEHDVDFEGIQADGRFEKLAVDDHVDWCYASLEDVKDNLLSTGYPADRLHFIKGDVVQTLPRQEMGDIALLRLDTDFYESTRAELNHLYPLVVDRGVVIIDDYGHWRGSQKAVDDYFGANRPLLCRLDYTGRLLVKANRSS